MHSDVSADLAYYYLGEGPVKGCVNNVLKNVFVVVLLYLLGEVQGVYYAIDGVKAVSENDKCFTCWAVVYGPPDSRSFTT
jgi:hypothetical protein